MINDFSVVSSFYEKLMAGVSGKWAAKVVRRVKKLAPNPRGADVGCGTGTVTRALAAAGFSVTGFDPSPEMLGEAFARGGEYVLGKMTDVKKLSGLGFVTAVNDVVNYLPPAQLVKNFAAVYAALDKGGVFLFDVSSIYRLRQVIGTNMFGEDREDLTYIWFNTQRKNGVLMELVYFYKEGNAYRREEESFFEYAHGADEIVSSLKAAGFGKVAVVGENGEIKAEDERWYFTAIK